MLSRLLLIPMLLVLAACQSQQIDHDFDATRDFSRYQDWTWQEPAMTYRPDDPRIRSDLTEQRVRSAIAQQLDQHGLRPATSGKPADLKVRAYLIVDDRQEQITSNASAGYWGPGWGGYWGGPLATETRTFDYKVATLQIDLFDGKDGKLVWRGSAEQVVNPAPRHPRDRDAQTRAIVARILSQYPPR
ncbi:DUF4136 domain-containing protein [Pseudomonas sp. LRF_L74]|uniref:DUF4136 domain-containing protein n=1 Tax=Pseudomonas sp. LRF_L74 TaxID=3369422 RepID=UPI003F60C32B